MSLEIPANFMLDYEGHLRAALAHDPSVVLTEIAEDAKTVRWADSIIACADLLVPNVSTPETKFSHDVFFASGVLACHGFMCSDVDDEVVLWTLKNLSLRSMPMSAVCDTRDTRAKQLAEIAREGHDAHPEFRDHTDIAVEYYTEVAQSLEMGKIAFCGTGIALYQLDRAFARAREVRIDQEWLALTQNVDWGAFPFDAEQ